MAKKTPGLFKRGDTWHIKKTVCGRKLSGSTGTTDLDEAERILANQVDEIRKVFVHGERPVVTFRDATFKYVKEKKGKKSIDRDIQAFAGIEPFIGDMDIRYIHLGVLQEYIDSRLAEGVKNITINRDLASLRQVLNRAARVWRHENNQPYLDTAPLIEMLTSDARAPYAMTMDEQTKLFSDLRADYARYALFLVNTGGRCRETLGLRWDWRLKGHQAFRVPPESHKNGQARIIACNSVAWSVIEAQKGIDADRVFPIEEQAFRMAWDRARIRTNLEHVRRHDLKHTFGMRLRAAGVSHSDRQDLLGHKSNNITDHYSGADINNLLCAAEKIVGMSVEPAMRLVSATNLSHREKQPEVKRA